MLVRRVIGTVIGSSRFCFAGWEIC